MSNNQTRAYVDPDQKDLKDAVQREDVEEDSKLDVEVKEQEARTKEWVDKDKAVQKRMGRLSRNLSKQFDQRLAEVEAEHQRERTEFQKRLDRLEGRNSGSDADEAKHKAEMDELERKQAAAFEAGDSALAASIGRQMAQKEGAFFEAKTRALIGSSRQAQEEPAKAATGELPTEYRPTAAGKKFVKAQEWWEDPEFGTARAAANVLYRQMIDDGEDSSEPAFYDKLARTLVQQMPHMKNELIGVELEERDSRGRLDDDFGDEEEPPPRQQQARRAPVQHNPDRGDSRGTGPRRRNGVHISKADEATMRAVGMDPTNDKHLVQFAKSKREVAEGSR